MAEDDRSRRIEFAAEQPAAGADEELPGGGGRRSRASLALVVAVLVGAAVVARALTHDGSPHRPTPAVTAVAQTPPVQRPVLPLPPRSDSSTARLERVSRAAWCPPAGDGLPACSSAPEVPTRVLAAVREHFPAAGHVAAFEEQLRDVGFGPGGLWYRQVLARQGPRAIIVEVHRRIGSDRTRIVEHVDASGSTLVVTRVVGGFAVRIRVSGPTGRHTAAVSPRALLAFAADARLRTPG